MNDKTYQIVKLRTHQSDSSTVGLFQKTGGLTGAGSLNYRSVEVDRARSPARIRSIYHLWRSQKSRSSEISRPVHNVQA